MSGIRFILGLVLMCTIAIAGNMWIETTQKDFADGQYSQNIYSSHLNNGTVEFVARYDLNNDGFIDLFSLSRSTSEISIYWGSAQGYSIGNKTSFPTDGTGNCESADLNNDGYPEFIASYGNADPRLVIFWGSASGYSYSNNLSIPTVSNEVTYVVDLNRDGYLDIIVGTSNSFSTSSIYWGSSSGYSSNNRTDLYTVLGAHNFEVADLNKDGWYDIVVVNNNANYNYVFWGSSNGYSSNNKTSLYLPNVSIPHGSSVADLNNDGYLDIIFTSVYSSFSYIYWGGANGFQSYQILNTSASYGGSSVVDINGDSYLDIVFFRGRPDNRPVIYWGSANGYSDNNRTEIGYSLSASGGLVADLNSDGYFDIYLNNYYGDSPIFWGPDYTSSFTFPCYLDHHAMFREIGNTYNRNYYEDYISSVFDAGTEADWGTVEWDATLATGASVNFWVRSGNVPEPDDSWSDWVAVENGGSIPEYLNARYLQYKSRLAYTNPAYLPSLEEVRISYNPTGAICAAVRIEPEVINLKNHGKFTAFITLPQGYNPSDIDLSTVQCEGAQAISGNATPSCFIAKFRVQDLVGVGPSPAVQFMVSGQLFNGMQFYGYDTVRVIGGSIHIFCAPNPFKKRTTINLTSVYGKNVQVKIYNLNGELVRNLDNISYHNGTGYVIWDRKDNRGRLVPSGVYLYNVKTETDFYTEKVVVLD